MTKFLFAALLIAAPAFAQQQATQPQPEGTEGSSKNAATCQQANASGSGPASKTEQGPNSGTASSNSGGSTGWSGSGFGGSQTGTTPGTSATAGPRDLEQPAVATGLDLAGTSAKPAQNKC
ncbi:hypothetical protein [Roseiterribacter gracilis]|uniref:Uncharacterized protein n=1 Tax=Roseiterribacter gracilis TaxID=2812848 RepID=A0A8S8XHA0_9PROT|nr:hypothetical protein TMPK1_35980 [Rhodospirillales bacterium TMPK1]